MMVYADASHQETTRGAGSWEGLIVQLAGTWWGVAAPLPPEMDNTTVELLALALGRWIVGCLRDLEAKPKEVVYDAQAAEALVEGCLHHQQDPLRKAIQWSVATSWAVHWWVRGHVGAPEDDDDCERQWQGNAHADEYAGVAARKSAQGYRVALPLSLGAVYGAQRADGPRSLEWRIHQQGNWRPPQQMDFRFEE